MLKPANFFRGTAPLISPWPANFADLGKQAEAEQQIADYSANVTVEPPLEDPLFERIHELNHSTTVHLERGMELEKVGPFRRGHPGA